MENKGGRIMPKVEENDDFTKEIVIGPSCSLTVTVPLTNQRRPQPSTAVSSNKSPFDEIEEISESKISVSDLAMFSTQNTPSVSTNMVVEHPSAFAIGVEESTSAAESETDKSTRHGFPCSSCTHVAFRRADLTIHERRHTGERPFPCTQCNYAAVRKDHLRRHMERHTTTAKPHMCTHCSYACAHRPDLKKHMRIHTNERPFKCDHCDYACGQRATLKRHARTRHGVDVPLIPRSLIKQTRGNGIGADVLSSYTGEHILNDVITAMSIVKTEPPTDDHALSDLSSGINNRPTMSSSTVSWSTVTTPPAPPPFVIASPTVPAPSPTRRTTFKCHECPYTCPHVDIMRHHKRVTHNTPVGEKATTSTTDGNSSQPPGRSIDQINATSLPLEVFNSIPQPIQIPTVYPLPGETQPDQSAMLTAIVEKHKGSVPIDFRPEPLAGSITAEESDDVKAREKWKRKLAQSRETSRRYRAKKREEHLATMTSEEQELNTKRKGKLPGESHDEIRKRMSRERSRRYRARKKIKFSADLTDGMTLTEKYTAQRKSKEGILARAPFKCTQCGLTFSYRFRLRLHQVVHTNIRAFACKVCDFKTKRSDTLLRHERIHSNDCRFKCTRCDYATNYPESLKRHESCHSEERNFKCAQCTYAGKTLVHLRRHLMIHSPRSPTHQCQLCGFNTPRAHDLTRHMITHSEDRPFKCDLCDFAGKEKRALRQHTERVHPDPENERPWYSCEKCKYRSRKETSLEKHRLFHEQRAEFKCQLCDYSSPTRLNVVEHVNRKHQAGGGRKFSPRKPKALSLEDEGPGDIKVVCQVMVLRKDGKKLRIRRNP